MKIERDGQGKTRVAKGDRTGLGGQYTPDPVKLDAAKNKIEALKAEIAPLKTVTLLDGTNKTLEYITEGYVCLVCGEEYDTKAYGYCDESLECAMDDGENLVKV
jgi:hypothetical protein